MVRLEKINDRNVWEILELRVRDDQKAFITTNGVSIVEAYTALTANGKVFTFGVYKGSVPVGFVMIGYGTDDDWDDAPMIARDNYSIWRLMIDRDHQGKGYGKEALKLTLDFIKTWPCGEADCCWVSYMPDDEVAHILFESFGFRDTGVWDADEKIAVLPLR